MNETYWVVVETLERIPVHSTLSLTHERARRKYCDLYTKNKRDDFARTIKVRLVPVGDE